MRHPGLDNPLGPADPWAGPSRSDPTDTNPENLPMRRLPLRFSLALAGVTFLSLVVALSIALAADAAPKPVAGIMNIMNAVNHPEHGMFGQIKGFIEKGGGDADAWKLMRHRAQVVAECGNILMGKSPPRGADDDAGLTKWKQHCASFRDATKKLSKALAFKKVPKAKAALEAVSAQCEACHKDHKSS